MKQDALHNLRTYWEKLRAGRVAPYRAELDPRAFEDVLENMFILEQLNPSQIRVRLAGMSLCEMMGMEVRGLFTGGYNSPMQEHGCQIGRYRLF